MKDSVCSEVFIFRLFCVHAIFFFNVKLKKYSKKLLCSLKKSYDSIQQRKKASHSSNEPLFGSYSHILQLFLWIPMCSSSGTCASQHTPPQVYKMRIILLQLVT